MYLVGSTLDHVHFKYFALKSVNFSKDHACIIKI